MLRFLRRGWAQLIGIRCIKIGSYFTCIELQLGRLRPGRLYSPSQVVNKYQGSMFGCTDCTPLTVTNVEKSLLSHAQISSQWCNARECTMPTRKADKAPVPNTERRDTDKSTSPRITTVQKTSTRENSHKPEPMHERSDMVRKVAGKQQSQHWHGDSATNNSSTPLWGSVWRCEPRYFKSTKYTKCQTTYTKRISLIYVALHNKIC